jgi:hypothetical protein
MKESNKTNNVHVQVLLPGTIMRESLSFSSVPIVPTSALDSLSGFI